MTPGSFWISVDAVALVLDEDSTLDAIEAHLREMTPAEQAEKLNEIEKIVSQLSRLGIRFRAGVQDKLTTVRSGRRQTTTVVAHRVEGKG